MGTGRDRKNSEHPLGIRCYTCSPKATPFGPHFPWHKVWALEVPGVGFKAIKWVVKK